MSGAPRYRIAEAAARHGLKPWTVRQLVREGRVEFFRIANRYELTDEAIERYLEQMKQAPSS